MRDTLIDLHNYAAMAVMLLDEKTKENYEADKKNINLRKIKKNDILYWKGQVALALSGKKLIHAYGPMKKTVVMNINQTIKRIEKTASLKIIGIKRL